MTVFVVESVVPYEGAQLERIFSNSGAAQAFADEKRTHAEDWSQARYIVSEWSVEEQFASIPSFPKQ
jgi:hypothetical protein